MRPKPQIPEAVRVGFFHSGGFHSEPDPDPTALVWAGVWIKTEGKHWQAVQTAIERGDPYSIALPLIALGKSLSIALGVPLETPKVWA